MTSRRALTVLILTAVLSVVGYGQDSHVRIIFSQDLGEANISSDQLYVINMPSQFMLVQLSGRYSRASQQTDGINLTFISSASKGLYEAESSHGLRIKADDQILDLGVLSYARVDDKGQKEGRAALPATALIASNKKTPLTIETMSVSGLKLDDLNFIAHAGTVVMRIGDTVFPFTPAQLGIVREFVSKIPKAQAYLANVSNADRAAAPPPADVPSDENHASLDVTLKWIKTEIEREGSTKGSVPERKLEPLDFGGCGLRYRVVPLFREVPGINNLVYAIMEYQLNLSDINADAIRVNGAGDYATIYVSSRQLEPKIKIFKHENEHGATGRTLEESSTSYVFMNLKNVEAANRFRFAMVHAIHLCQGQNQK